MLPSPILRTTRCPTKLVSAPLEVSLLAKSTHSTEVAQLTRLSSKCLVGVDLAFQRLIRTLHALASKAHGTNMRAMSIAWTSTRLIVLVFPSNQFEHTMHKPSPLRMHLACLHHHGMPKGLIPRDPVTIEGLSQPR